MTEHSSVAESIRATRLASGISLRTLAATLGVSPATLSAVERGLTPISVSRLEKVAAVLGVPADRLLRGEIVAVAQQLSRKDAHAGVQASGVGLGSRDWRDFEALPDDPILAAAIVLFVRKGFHASSMREIAAQAGLSVSGIYHHYPSKESILVALLNLTMGEIGWRLDAARLEGSDPAQSFALMVESLALFHAVRGDLAFLGASEMRGLGMVERSRVAALRDAVQHALDEQARVCVASSDFSVVDHKVACRAIATMCTSLPSWFRSDGPLTAPEVAGRYADYALGLMGWQEPNGRSGLGERSSEVS